MSRSLSSYGSDKETQFLKKSYWKMNKNLLIEAEKYRKQKRPDKRQEKIKSNRATNIVYKKISDLNNLMI